jgi:hypothetical protein
MALAVECPSPVVQRERRADHRAAQMRLFLKPFQMGSLRIERLEMGTVECLMLLSSKIAI